MNERLMQSTGSPWLAGSAFPDAGALHEDTVADVCVVGGGIAGLTTAYLLGKAGKNVVVLEAEHLAAGESGRTTAHLASALDDRFTELEKLHGSEGARLAAESHAAAIDRIEAVARDEGISCDFARVDGYLFAPRDEQRDVLDRELAAARRAGLEVEPLPRAPWPSYDTGPCLRFSRQGQFHPGKYLAALASAVRRQGGRIFVHSPVKVFEGGAKARAETRAGHAVRAGALVVATNTPVNDRMAIHTKQFPYRTYAVAFGLPTGSVPRALYWDTEDPYHYVRLAEAPGGREILIVGGEDHKTGQGRRHEPDCFSRLEAWTRERFPEAGEEEYRWSGQVMEPLDGLAFIGRNPGDENVFIATGDSGHGMTHGTIAGLLLTDLILGRENPWAKVYEPSRKSLRAAGEFVRENVNVAAQYLDWVMPGEVGGAAKIAPGEGAVVREGLRKVAVCKDSDGKVHRHSAVCPHLGCIVHWNDAEKSWDCPCHGSRFSPQGQVINGPALGGLAPAES
jgi:glycine/D-amino acid oxidase-like deaminating enzyme/nitrite reductase/ring-hydroxylating ferredoxin subunit